MAVRRQDILRKFMISIWAMVTLVLFFSVILLVREMLETGQDPLAALRVASEQETEAMPAPRRQADILGARELTLYFATSDGRVLAPEIHTIEFSGSTVENCKRALQKLIAGPRDILTPILPATAKIRAMYLLENGELVVDFSRELLSEHARFKSASLEALMVYGVVNTLTQETLRSKNGVPVRQVRFLFEGLPPLENFPAHLDLRQPVGPDQRWIELTQEFSPNV